MSVLETVDRYFRAWNARDPEAIVATFAEGGTYSDPIVPDGIGGAALAQYAQTLFEGFPDLAFETVGPVVVGDGIGAAQWLMTGTNTAPYMGLPPTGRSVSLPGADFIRVEPGGIRSVRAHFDRRGVPEQLGLQVLVQPKAIGPLLFGDSTYVASGKTTKPGAFSITVVHARSEAAAAKIHEYTKRMLQEELQTMPGFLGVTVGKMGGRMFTVTAWDGPESAAGVHASAIHNEAVAGFFDGDLGAGGWTGVFVPHHTNDLMVLCPGCGRMVKSERPGAACACGAALPELAYW